MKDFLLKTFKDKKQVFIFVTILLVAFTTFSLLNALLTEDTDPVAELNEPKIPGRYGSEDDLEIPDREDKEEESMIPPVENGEYTFTSRYYDVNASEEEQVNTMMIIVNNVFKQSKSTGFKSESGEEFNVVAVFSGKVTKVSSNVLFGNFVEIEHDNGVVTIYSSVDEIKVEVDQRVDQGDVIAVSGNCDVDADKGLQVRLELRKDGKKVNPETNLGTKLDEIN